MFTTRTLQRAAVGAAVLTLTLVLAAPAADADKPERIEGSVTFVDISPCTGLEHEVTIDVDARVHRHDERIVATIKRSGTTSDGYSMDPGSNEQFVNNGNWVITRFRDKWSDDHGSSFRAEGRLKVDLDTGEVVRDDFELVCTG